MTDVRRARTGPRLSAPNRRRGIAEIDLPYSLTSEATAEADFFGFHSNELPGFTGVGHSVENCMYLARRGMREHVEVLTEQGLPVPPTNADAVVLIRKEIRDAA